MSECKQSSERCRRFTIYISMRFSLVMFLAGNFFLYRLWPNLILLGKYSLEITWVGRSWLGITFLDWYWSDLSWKIFVRSKRKQGLFEAGVISLTGFLRSFFFFLLPKTENVCGWEHSGDWPFEHIFIFLSKRLLKGKKLRWQLFSWWKFRPGFQFIWQNHPLKFRPFVKRIKKLSTLSATELLHQWPLHIQNIYVVFSSK